MSERRPAAAPRLAGALGVALAIALTGGATDAARAGQVLAPDTLAALAEGAVRRAVAPLAPGATVACQAVDRLEPLDLPDGHVRIDVTLPHGGPAALMTPICRVFVEERLVRTTPVPLRVRVVGPRFRATRRVDAGNPLGPDDVVRAVEEIPPPWGAALTDSMLALGLVARRAIGAGEALRADAVAPPPVVRRGDRVTLVVESSTVRILATGTARSEGRAGDLVRVVRDGTRHSLAARVVGPCRVSLNVYPMLP